MYWSGSTTIYRASLNSVRLNSSLESCASDISSKFPLINNTQLETFTIEHNDAIYYIGFDPCFETSPVPILRTNRSILGTPLNAGTVRIYTGVANSGPVVSTDSFDRTLFSAIDDFIVLVDTSTVATCPNFPVFQLFQAKGPVLSLRMFQSVKQPLPGKQIYSVIVSLSRLLLPYSSCVCSAGTTALHCACVICICCLLALPTCMPVQQLIVKLCIISVSPTIHFDRKTFG